MRNLKKTLISKFSKTAESKINIKKSAAFHYITNKQFKNEIKKIPFIIMSKRIKYLEIN